MTTLLSPFGSNIAGLVALYNNARSTNLTVEEFEANFNVDLPQRNAEPTDNRNTFIIITPRLQSKYIGNFMLKYDRVHVGELPEIVIDRPLDAVYVHDVLPTIIEKYGIQLTENDVVNNELTGVDSTPIELEINPMSILYYAGPVIVNQGYFPFIDVEKQIYPAPADGFPLGQLCVDTTLNNVLADGVGNTRLEEIETNSLVCGFIEPYTPPSYPPRGTALHYECQGFTRIGVFADGIGGEETSVIEENSELCGYVP